MNNFKASALPDDARTARLRVILQAMANGQTLKEIAPTIRGIHGGPMTLHGLATFYYREMHEVGCANGAHFVAYAIGEGWIKPPLHATLRKWIS